MRRSAREKKKLWTRGTKSMADFHFIRSSIPKEKEAMLAGISKPTYNNANTLVNKPGSCESMEGLSRSPVNLRNFERDLSSKNKTIQHSYDRRVTDKEDSNKILKTVKQLKQF